jgi:hypothetical protein
MSEPSLTGTGSAAPAEGRAAANTPTGPTPAGQTPGRAEVHAYDAPPPPTRRPVVAGAGAGLRLAAGGPTPRRPGRRRSRRPPAGGHRRAAHQHTRPAPPGGPTAPALTQHRPTSTRTSTRSSTGSSPPQQHLPGTSPQTSQAARAVAFALAQQVSCLSEVALISVNLLRVAWRPAESAPLVSGLSEGGGLSAHPRFGLPASQRT